MQENIVSYKDFGAVGDGYTDDYLSIFKAHEYANSIGAAVVADKGARYYMGPNGRLSCIIRTSVDWTGATFIIDDSKITLEDESMNAPLFIVEPSLERFTLPLESLAKGAESLGVKPGVPCLIMLVDETQRRYIRFGPNANKGVPQSEIILVDADGRIDPDTPPTFEYKNITSHFCIPTDEEPVTLKGGHFITVANATFPKRWVAFERGIRVKRSNTTVEGLKHSVVGDNPYRCAYHGIIVAENSNNILIKDCEFQAMQNTYFKGADGKDVLIGSYETGGRACNNITWQGCTQSNFFNPDGSVNQAGMMGSNLLKNVKYIDNFVGSFDAHTGLYNLYMKGCTIKGMGIQGGGLAVLEDVHMYKPYAMHLKCDYGSGWDGDFVFKNVTLDDPGKTDRYYLFRTHWVNHDFGYKVKLPRRVTVENMKLPDGCHITYLRSFFDGHIDVSADKLIDGSENKNPVAPTELITVIDKEKDLDFRLNDGEFLKHTSLEFKKQT